MEINPDALDRWITGNYGEDRWERGRDGLPVESSSGKCPECSCEDVSDRQGHIRPDGDERPPFLMVCEGCGHEWEEE